MAEPRVWCPDSKAEVEHPEHWHVIRVDNITFAQGQCHGWPEPPRLPGWSEPAPTLLPTPDRPYAAAEHGIVTVSGTGHLHVVTCDRCWSLVPYEHWPKHVGHCS